MDDSPNDINTKQQLAELVRQTCIDAAREGFMDASMSGLCTDGAMKSAISAIQKLDIETIVDQHHSK